jgi:hypothetical protein
MFKVEEETERLFRLNGYSVGESLTQLFLAYGFRHRWRFAGVIDSGDVVWCQMATLPALFLTAATPTFPSGSGTKATTVFVAQDAVVMDNRHSSPRRNVIRIVQTSLWKRPRLRISPPRPRFGTRELRQPHQGFVFVPRFGASFSIRPDIYSIVPLSKLSIRENLRSSGLYMNRSKTIRLLLPNDMIVSSCMISPVLPENPVWTTSPLNTTVPSFTSLIV